MTETLWRAVALRSSSEEYLHWYGRWQKEQEKATAQARRWLDDEWVERAWVEVLEVPSDLPHIEVTR